MIHQLFEIRFLGNSLYDYIWAVGIFTVVLLIVHVFSKHILSKLKKIVEKTEGQADDFIVSALNSKLVPLLYIGALYLALQRLTLTVSLQNTFNVIFAVILTIYGVRFSLAILLFFIENYWLNKEKEEAKKDALKGIVTVIKVIVWGVAITLLLDNIGVKISAIVAGLGIGGVAIALAAQAILADLFSYITIFFDRPFEIGDFIIIDQHLGVVEHIGIKTTRIRSLSGEQLIFANTDLTNSRLKNYKRMERRRVLFKLGVTYQTSTEQLKKIPHIIKNIIENLEDAEFDRAHFASYGDFSLNFEIVYYVIGNDYNKYMDIQQEINLQIKEEFKAIEVEFAYPTETVYLNR